MNDDLHDYQQCPRDVCRDCAEQAERDLVAMMAGVDAEQAKRLGLRTLHVEKPSV